MSLDIRAEKICCGFPHPSPLPSILMLTLGFAGVSTYQDQVAEVVTALTDAKVAIFPIDPGGLQVASVFESSTTQRGGPELINVQQLGELASVRSINPESFCNSCKTPRTRCSRTSSTPRSRRSMDSFDSFPLHPSPELPLFGC